MTDEKEGKWIFNHGCHNGTLLSRDTGYPEEYDTEAEALAAWQDYRKAYSRMGYQLWFAKLTSPDGVTRTLESNPYY